MKHTYEAMFIVSGMSAVNTRLTFEGCGLRLSATDTSLILCHALSQNGRRMAVAVRPGIIYFVYIPEGYKIDVPDAPPLENAEEVSSSEGESQKTPELQMQLTLFHAQRQWKILALRDASNLYLAAMDSDGQIEIWRWERCAWHREKVKQRHTCPAFDHGGAALEWDRDPSVSRLFMTTYYHQRFYFERRRGLFGPYWVQSEEQIVQVPR